MKKIMMFLFMTCLVGGFAIEASAQNREIDWTNKLVDYDNAITGFVERGVSSTKVDKIKSDLEQNKDKLTSKQLKKFQSLNADYERAKEKKAGQGKATTNKKDTKAVEKKANKGNSGNTPKKKL